MRALNAARTVRIRQVSVEVKYARRQAIHHHQSAKQLIRRLRQPPTERNGRPPRSLDVWSSLEFQGSHPKMMTHKRSSCFR